MPAILNLDTYVKKFRLHVRPDIIAQVISKHHAFTEFMITQTVKKYMSDPEHCLYCREKRHKYYPDGMSVIPTNIPPADYKAMLCKKHASVYVYESHMYKTAKLIYKDVPYVLFSNYAIRPMPTDKRGLYVISFSPIVRNKFSLFALNNKYFPKLECVAKDITEDIVSHDLLTVSNLWMLDMRNPLKIERMK